MDPPMGDKSFQDLLDDIGVGGFIVFKKGDKAVTLHTAQPNGEEHLVSLEGGSKNPPTEWRASRAEGPVPAAEETIL